MLKAYAVALILTTATPVVVNSVEGAKVLENTKAPTANFLRPGTIKD
jgi:hypothetical protein